MSACDPQLWWIVAGSVGLAGFGLSALFLVWRLRGVEEFRVVKVRQATLPSLSVVIPARNQGAELAATVRSLVAQRYPGLQLVVVDDRSTDSTGTVANELAAEHDGMGVVHVTELPVGWLGKVHALQQGLAVCDGDLVLFTDVDTRLAPGALAAAAACMLERGLDHLTILPWVVLNTIPQMLLSTMVRTGIVATWPTPPRSSTAAAGAYAGFGPFNLVRRQPFMAGKGFAHIKLEVLDDMGVGLLMNETGRRSGVLVSRGAVALAWYPSLVAMWRGLEKNLFVGLARLSYVRALGLVMGCVVAPILPLAAAHPLAWPCLWPAALVAFSCHGWYVVTARRRLGERWWSAALLPLGLLLFAPAMLNSILTFVWRGGIIWSGTFYSAQEVRRGKRVWR